MKPILGILFFLILFLTSCSTIKITSSWQSKEEKPGNYKKIMVMGLIRDSDRNLLEKMENHVVNDLKALGYDAISSFTEYGPKAFENLSEEAALSKIRGIAVDAVITMVLLDKQKERKYVPANVFYSPYAYYQNRFWGYRFVLYSRIYEPGYYITNTKYFIESNLYNMNSQKLVYSVQTQSFDPASFESMGHEFGKMIINDMIKKNILKNIAKSTQ